MPFGSRSEQTSAKLRGGRSVVYAIRGCDELKGVMAGMQDMGATDATLTMGRKASAQSAATSPAGTTGPIFVSSAGVSGVMDAAAIRNASGDWPAANIPNDEAIYFLATTNSGVKPDLSRHAYRAVKRAFDIVASGIALAILLIPGLILSAVICIKSPGAGPLYSQVRVGRLKKDGSYKLFRMYKFRSMVPNADKMLDELKDLNEADGPLFKIKDDPRIIPGIGTFIRKHSIDELPQLINVFIGDMSLVGPRPALPCEVVQYNDRAKQRLVAKCGCGGAWQAGSRSDSTFEEMIDLDLDYIKKSSPLYDLRLILDTLRTMVSAKGAY